MPISHASDMNRIVYIKEIKLGDLPQSMIEAVAEAMPAKIDREDDKPLYVVCSAEGMPISIMDDRSAAFMSARHYNLEPHSVH